MKGRNRVCRISLAGQALIREPLLNKGSAFTAAEREAFGLTGLLPHHPTDIELQARRNMEALDRFDDPLEKYVALAALQDRNEHLYFYLLRTHLEALMPIVYTPTVGEATHEFSHVFQRGRGVWITPDQQGRVAETLGRAARGRKISLIVATDNESILGIGDQGAGGIAISIGKLALYTAGAGIDPATVLPVSLDVGTNNEGLLADPMYLGWPGRRLRGAEYDALIGEFVEAVRDVFPGALLQWEDFRKDNALRILDRYSDVLPSFNDDIQGTGAVALAGILSAQALTGRRMSDERIVIVGAGAAGLGICRQIRTAIMEHGVGAEAAHAAVAVLDSRGLLVDDDSVSERYKQEMAWSAATAERYGLRRGEHDLEAICAAFQPTVLIGTSGQPGAFTEAAVRAVAAHTAHPVILPLSNPTALSEATPQQIIDWTDGQALVAAGSPFGDVEFGGRRHRVGQGNNALIFPGVGLGVLAGGARRVTPALFTAAAAALADAMTPEERESGLLYPSISRLCEVSDAVAAAVMIAAGNEGLCTAIDRATAQARLAACSWSPDYPRYEYDPDAPAYPWETAEPR